MSANLYCDRSDVTKRLPLGAIPSLSGIPAETSSGANTITFDGHGLETDDPVTLRAIEGGSLPSPLVAGTRYYAIRVSNALFQLASSPGGIAIDITTLGLSFIVAREPDFDDAIEFYSRWADDFFPAHLVPLQVPIHPLVKGIVADLAAKRIMNIGGQDSAVVNAAEIAGKAQLERHAAGLTLRGASVTSSANLAIRRPLGNTGDPRGWGSSRIP